MSERFQAHRSKEAPMDYQWTNRDQVKPVWASTNDPNTPRKRPHDVLNSQPTPFSAPQTPMFGSNQNVPFIFDIPPTPATPQPYPWAPPPQFSPSKAFPNQEELKDIDMSELSPEKDNHESKSPENGRPIAMGGLRRVFKQRQKSRGRVQQQRQMDEGHDMTNSEDEGEDAVGPLTQNTSHHYTLNIPAPAPPQSDMPYVLLGYLQFFFNLSLILLFLYLVVQFIITVQRDVEQRISEYSQEIVQEIAMCALQYKNNLCASNAVPAMNQQCANWETCMNRDPTVVGRAKVGAELIAEVVNGFVEPISWKTLIFTLTSLAFLTVFINALLSLYRSRHQPIPAAPHHPAPFPIPPPTTPYAPYGGYLSPAHNPGWMRQKHEDDMETPTRRRRLEGGEAAKIK